MSLTDKQISEMKQFLAERQNAGLRIDPDTAEVDWTYAQTLDSYGIDPDLPEELPPSRLGIFREGARKRGLGAL
jgi:hypothetical protein